VKTPFDRIAVCACQAAMGAGQTLERLASENGVRPYKGVLGGGDLQDGGWILYCLGGATHRIGGSKRRRGQLTGTPSYNTVVLSSMGGMVACLALMKEGFHFC